MQVDTNNLSWKSNCKILNDINNFILDNTFQFSNSLHRVKNCC